ncbi:MAG: hypothetical protein HKN18_17985 [Silicimonas sp.]|nr:hypothetical protein [Silicimonas sp.]
MVVPKGMPIMCFVICAGILAACSRDSDDGLRARLDQWFFLGETVYFKSQMRCTAAMYDLTIPTPRPSLPVQSTPNQAKNAFDGGEVSALQMPGYSPNDLTDAMLLEGRGTMGKESLAAGAQAVPCFEGSPARTRLRDALTRPGATMVYDRGTDALIILDPEARLLFYVAGDVW